MPLGRLQHGPSVRGLSIDDTSGRAGKQLDRRSRGNCKTARFAFRPPSFPPTGGRTLDSSPAARNDNWERLGIANGLLKATYANENGGHFPTVFPAKAGTQGWGAALAGKTGRVILLLRTPRMARRRTTPLAVIPNGAKRSEESIHVGGYWARGLVAWRARCSVPMIPRLRLGMTMWGLGMTMWGLGMTCWGARNCQWPCEGHVRG